MRVARTTGIAGGEDVNPLSSVGWIHTSGGRPVSSTPGVIHRPVGPYGRTSANPATLSSHFTKLHPGNHVRKGVANGMPTTDTGNVKLRSGTIRETQQRAHDGDEADRTCRFRAFVSPLSTPITVQKIWRRSRNRQNQRSRRHSDRNGDRNRRRLKSSRTLLQTG